MLVTNADLLWIVQRLIISEQSSVFLTHSVAHMVIFNGYFRIVLLIPFALFIPHSSNKIQSILSFRRIFFFSIATFCGIGIYHVIWTTGCKPISMCLHILRKTSVQSTIRFGNKPNSTIPFVNIDSHISLHASLLLNKTKTH